MSKQHNSEELRAIKERLKNNKLTTEDVRKLEEIIINVEDAAAKLRAAVVE